MICHSLVIFSGLSYVWEASVHDQFESQFGMTPNIRCSLVGLWFYILLFSRIFLYFSWSSLFMIPSAPLIMILESDMPLFWVKSLWSFSSSWSSSTSRSSISLWSLPPGPWGVLVEFRLPGLFLWLCEPVRRELLRLPCEELLPPSWRELWSDYASRSLSRVNDLYSLSWTSSDSS